MYSYYSDDNFRETRKDKVANNRKVRALLKKKMIKKIYKYT